MAEDKTIYGDGAPAADPTSDDTGRYDSGNTGIAKSGASLLYPNLPTTQEGASGRPPADGGANQPAGQGQAVDATSEETKDPAKATTPGAPVPSLPQPFVNAISEKAKQYEGTLTYPNRGEGRTNIPNPYDVHGVSDCSAFVATVYAKNNVTLPADSNSLYIAPKLNDIGYDRNEWKPGDLVFWGKDGSTSHVAIYAGNGEVYNMGRAGGCQKMSIDDLENSLKKDGAQPMGARRLRPQYVPQ